MNKQKTITEQEQRVFETRTYGTQTETNKLYLVQWTYCANFDFYYAWAEDAQEAREMSFYGPRVRFIVTEVNPESLPVEFVEVEE